MKFAVLAVIGVFAPAAFAQESETQFPTTRIGIQLRVDAVQTTIDPEGGDEEKSFNLQVRTARLLAAGAISPTLQYVLRLDVKSPKYSDRNQDGAIPALERAYLETKPLEGLALRFGRVPFAAGSMENNYSSIDQYIASYMVESIYGGLSPINAAFEAGYTVMSQSVVLQVTNGLQESNDFRGTQKSDDLNYSLAYRGRLANGIVRPIVIVNQFSRIRGESGDLKDEAVKYSAFGVGSGFHLFNAELEVEYDTVKKPEFDALTQVDEDTVQLIEQPENEIVTTVFQLAYNVPEFNVRPALKYAMDKHEVDGKDFYESKRTGVSVEFHPGPRGFRYHVAYTIKDEDRTSGDTETNTKTTTLLAGIVGRL